MAHENKHLGFAMLTYMLTMRFPTVSGPSFRSTAPSHPRTPVVGARSWAIAIIISIMQIFVLLYILAVCPASVTPAKAVVQPSAIPRHNRHSLAWLRVFNPGTKKALTTTRVEYDVPSTRTRPKRRPKLRFRLLRKKTVLQEELRKELLRKQKVAAVVEKVNKKEPIPIARYEDFRAIIESVGNKTNALPMLSVKGEGTNHHENRDHPVVKILQERYHAGSKPGKRTDNFKIGLAIEGGGMRGSVSAGAAAAVHMLGLHEAFDCVYGSSAGALVGAFFVSRQLNSTVIYSDILPKAGKDFLDKGQLLPACGIKLPGKKRPVINLEFLLKHVVETMTPIDWETFWVNNQVQPVKIIASGLNSMKSISLNSQDGHFDSWESLVQCLRASMCVPGVAGPVVQLGAGEEECPVETVACVNEPLADALIFEPIPYRSAVEDGCTHVLILRSRPDGSEVLGKKASGFYERFIAKRFFTKDHKLTDAAKHMAQLDHLKIYAEDILKLNEGVTTRKAVSMPKGGKGEGRKAYILPIAPSENCVEVNTLEGSKRELTRGIREGFAHAWDLLAPPEVLAQCSGHKIAEEIFPDPGPEPARPSFLKAFRNKEQ